MSAFTSYRSAGLADDCSYCLPLYLTCIAGRCKVDGITGSAKEVEDGRGLLCYIRPYDLGWLGQTDNVVPLYVWGLS